ncbi:MAG: pentapeptide repeat-containing protein [Xanthobacteraceae bacterium]
MTGGGDVTPQSLADILDRLLECAAKNEPRSFRALVQAAALDPARDFVGASLRGIDFRDEDLRGFDFSKADLTGADFRRANVTGVSFDGAELRGAIGLPDIVQLAADVILQQPTGSDFDDALADGPGLSSGYLKQAGSRRFLKRFVDYISDQIVAYLSRPLARYEPLFAPDPAVVRKALKPGDILLIEGNTRLSATIKHLTQSTWSHATLCVGERPGDNAPSGEPNILLEADIATGVVTVPLTKYASFHTRICRPVGLDAEGAQKVVDYALKRIGQQYDSKRIVDLARYLFPYPEVPVWLRRRMLTIGSGDPTKAIATTLIAEAFASIHYPILPERASINGKTYSIAPYAQSEFDHIRTYGMYTPRDFDVSPFFEIVKPTIFSGLDSHAVERDHPVNTAVEVE